MNISRPYYLCPHCHIGQFPADVELDIENTESSPGVRRMEAVVGQEAPFDHRREQMKILAGLEVTTKAVERTAEAIGDDIARGEQQEVQRAVQLDLPIVIGAPVPMLYVQMDGTGVPVVKKETEGRKGKTDGQPAHTREAKLGCAFTQTASDEEGFAIRDPDSTTYVGAIETAEEFGKRGVFEMAEKKQLPDPWFFWRGGIAAWPRPKDGLAQKSTKVTHFGRSEVDSPEPGSQNENPGVRIDGRASSLADWCATGTWK